MISLLLLGEVTGSVAAERPAAARAGGGAARVEPPRADGCMTHEIVFNDYKFKINVALDIAAFFCIECVYNLYRISVQKCRLCAPAAATRATNAETQGLPLAVNGGRADCP